ncbi:MAG: PHP domain-containing protein [Candidatus Micrarchaeota archaeon]|nr:PHP domain-containing protein [Candidatus Micrarchaeota archaeon]
MVLADLHIHTRISADSISSPKDIISAAEKAGIGAVAFTDHNRFGAAKGVKSEKVIVIQGEEVLTDQGEVIGLFLNSPITKFELAETLEEMKSQDAIVILPHPLDRLRNGINPYEIPKGLLKFIHGFEVFNSRVIFDDDNKAAMEAAEKLNKTKIASSDAHVVMEIGNAHTEMEASNPEQMRKALLEGKTKVWGRHTSYAAKGLASLVHVGKKAGLL